MTTALTFNETTLHPVQRKGYLWIRASELANALGFSREDKVSRIYQRHADEFTDGMTQVIENVAEPQNGGLINGRCRIFSPRGCHLIAMFARTPVAKAFRRWVLDVLDNINEQNAGLMANTGNCPIEGYRPSLYIAAMSNINSAAAIVRAMISAEGVRLR